MATLTQTTTTASSPLATFPPAALRKARTLIESGRIAHVEGGHEYLATGSDGVTRYIVNAYTQTCACPAGVNGRKCYHLASALALDEGAAPARTLLTPEFEEAFAEVPCPLCGADAETNCDPDCLCYLPDSIALDEGSSR